MLEGRVGLHAQKRIGNAVGVVYGEGGSNSSDENAGVTINDRVSAKAIQALEIAVERASRNLEELALRSRQTIGEVIIPVERVDRVAAGVEADKQREVRDVVPSDHPEKLQLGWGEGEKKSARQIMGAEGRVEFSTDSASLALRMRQMQMSNVSALSRR